MKKIFCLLFVLCCFSGLFAFEWAFSKGNGTLTISGEGAMPDFEDKEISGGKDIPWNKYSEDITTIIIKDGVTSIGANAFAYLFHLDRIYLPESLESIGFCAFNWCPKLREPDFPSGLQKIEDGAFLYSTLINEITLGPDVEFDVGKAFCHGVKVNIVGVDENKKEGAF